jgi:ABC-type sugar transport system ATPase subunit
MNFIEGMVEVVDGKAYFLNSAMRMEITKEQYNGITENKANSCYVGIRPEHLHLEAEARPNMDGADLRGHVLFTELIGADQNVHAEVGKRIRVTFKASSDIQLKEDEMISLRVSKKHMLFYDMNTGKLVA